MAKIGIIGIGNMGSAILRDCFTYMEKRHNLYRCKQGEV